MPMYIYENINVSEKHKYTLNYIYLKINLLRDFLYLYLRLPFFKNKYTDQPWMEKEENTAGYVWARGCWSFTWCPPFFMRLPSLLAKCQRRCARISPPIPDNGQLLLWPQGTADEAAAASAYRDRHPYLPAPEEEQRFPRGGARLGRRGQGRAGAEVGARGNFREAHLPTIEDTYSQALGRSRKAGALHITDTTGGRRYRGLQRLAIARGHAFILVYSVTKKQTLEELKPLYELIRQLKGNNPQKCPIILVGNKCDESHREVSEKEGAAYASEWNCAFLETSAKMNINVQELFQMLINFEKKPAAAAAAGAQPPQKKSQIPKTAEKLLGKCIIM